MIKLSTRGNLQYPILLLISSFVRDVETELISTYLSFNINLIYVPLMSIGEIIFGLIIYLYQKKYLKHNLKYDHKKSYGTNIIKLIIKNKRIKTQDNGFKIFILIVIMSYYDFIQFLLSNELMPKFFASSYSLESRLNGILIISEAFFYRFVLKLTILKHQIFSLSIISCCLIIMIILKFIFQDYNIYLSIGKFVSLIIIVVSIKIFNSHLDLIEKYLFDYDYINPFQALLFEGILCLLYSAIYIIYKKPMPEIKEYYNNNSDKAFVLLFLFVIYIILSGIKNSYRVITNKIFSPMATTLAIYFLNPIYIIICLVLKNDFISGGKTNYLYFSINFILAVIISFSACIYNEFVILFFFGLQHETYKQISHRAKRITPSVELTDILDDDDSQL